MQDRNGHFLTTSVFFNDNYHNNYIREYRCFIKTPDDIIFVAVLEPYHNENLSHVPNRVFVRLPIRGYPVYTGILHINNDFEPTWIHYEH